MPDLASTVLSMVRGDSQSFDIALLLKGKPMPIPAGSSFWFTAKRGIDDLDSAAVFKKTSGGGGVNVIDALNGIARVDLVPGDTSILTCTTVLVWDLQMKDPSGAIHTLAMGTLTVTLDVTTATT